MTSKQFESEYDETIKFIYDTEIRLNEIQKYMQYLENRKSYLIKLSESNEHFQKIIKACDESMKRVRQWDKERIDYERNRKPTP